MLQEKFDQNSTEAAFPKPELKSGDENSVSPSIKVGLLSRLKRRHVLLLLGPVVVLAGILYFWVTGGKSVSTDNAYVKSDQVMIAAEVSGAIVEVAIQENQHVDQGDLLFRIDDREYRIRLARAEAQLAAVRDEISSLKAAYHQKEEELVLARSDVAYAEKEFERQKQLVSSNVASQSKYDSASHEADQARQRIHVIEQELAQIRAQLAGNPDIPVAEHPRFLEAKAARDEAALDLDHTKVISPLAGVASNTPDVGQWVAGSSLFASPVMSIVGDEHFWVEANLKETQLADVKPGQIVTIKVDAFPGKKWTGKVDSISRATGAEFSVIPPQNASGNWVKVVQRVPVRISVDSGPDQLSLRSGMSASVKINTGKAGRQAHAAQSPDTTVELDNNKRTTVSSSD